MFAENIAQNDTDGYFLDMEKAFLILLSVGQLGALCVPEQRDGVWTVNGVSIEIPQIGV